MGLLTILKKVKEKEKEVRLLILYVVTIFMLSSCPLPVSLSLSLAACAWGCGGVLGMRRERCGLHSLCFVLVARHNREGTNCPASACAHHHPRAPARYVPPYNEATHRVLRLRLRPLTCMLCGLIWSVPVPPNSHTSQSLLHFSMSTVVWTTLGRRQCEFKSPSRIPHVSHSNPH